MSEPTTAQEETPIRVWSHVPGDPNHVADNHCPPHSWIRDGSGAVCTHCGYLITEVEKYAPPDVIQEDQERGM